MPKLHEVLAVEGSLKSQADKTRTDLALTFEKRRHLFMEKVVTFIPNTEDGVAVKEEQLDLQSTIPKELEWIAGIWGKALDAAYHIAEANMSARADITLDDGTLIFSQVPVTGLLELEKRAAEIFALVAVVPTLDPAKGFSLDPARGKGIYKARDHQATRTKKVQGALVLYEATKEHPAQVKEISTDQPTGTLQTLEWSGLITPSEKADMLDRAEQLQRAIKKARSRANDVEVNTAARIGQAMFGYVLGRQSGASSGS